MAGSRRQVSLLGPRDGWRLPAVAISVLAWLFVSAPGAAADGKKAPPGRTHRVQAVSPLAYKKLSKVQKALGEKRYADALRLLGDLARNKRLNDYERALVEQSYGYVYAGQERYDKAAESFERCLSLHALPEAAARDLRFNLAQLYLALGRVDAAIERLEQWFAEAEHPSPRAYALLASAYAQRERYRDAIPLVRKAIANSPKPPKNWFRLLLGMYVETEQLPAAAALLERMLERFPDDAMAWKQLASIDLELDRQRKALEVLALAYRRGYLTESADLVRLAKLYLLDEVPYAAAQLLERELAAGRIESTAENWELLANAWLQAQETERALAPLRKAAAIAADGERYLRLAQLYLSLEKPEEARHALDRALEKGKLKEPGRAQLLLGIARFQTGDTIGARRAFERAQRDPSVREQALQWLKHLETEARAD